jgi:IS1 family transposase
MNFRAFFDDRDDELLRIVNGLKTGKHPFQYTKKKFFPYFHPKGMKEMAETKGLRIAYAVAYLLDSLDAGEAQDRLKALTMVREDLINSAEGPLPKNTARVLLEIMKELVRSREDPNRQLELAHDFRTAAAGKPRIIRDMLNRYHLLEMPEEWNQVAFDDHVHDANTKGRKSSSHLIMDAWIKGIRRLRVIYYNFISPASASELLEAARIMEMDVRIGIEFCTRFRHKFVRLIWVPRGFGEVQAFLCFLEEPSVVSLMADGKAVYEFQKRHVMGTLKQFNEVHRPAIKNRYGLDLPALRTDAFQRFVGAGQASLHHLAKFIHLRLQPFLATRVQGLKKLYDAADAQERQSIETLVAEMDAMDPDWIYKSYLCPEANPSLPDPESPDQLEDLPELMRFSPKEIVVRLSKLHPGYRITLNLSNLDAADVLEILYDCEGMITRLEIFNLKDYAQGKTRHIPDIDALQQAINQGSAIALKKQMIKIIDTAQKKAEPDLKDRIDKLTGILHDIDQFRAFYQTVPLKARIGSDSTGWSPRVHGMGLAIVETLPARARRVIRRPDDDHRDMVPFHMTVRKRVTLVDKEGALEACHPLLQNCPESQTPFRFFRRKTIDWDVREKSIRMAETGNIVTLGGVQKNFSNRLSLLSPQNQADSRRIPLRYLNSGAKNFLKILIGFFPAFLTFFLTYDWWVLAYLGAVIWFAVTGLRNILQSVLGGGGFRRSHLLHWNDYVSWERISDSLLYTGFSVPLLDFLTKNLLLDRSFGITTATAPVALYGVMALANGAYISSHNIFRGLPRGAVYANFFRSMLSIPLALGLNFLIGSLMTWAGMTAVDDALQKWAAVISKFSSDCVAGGIEGTADRFQNVRMCLRDYGNKLSKIMETFTHLELLYPERSVLKMFSGIDDAISWSRPEAEDYEKIITIHALDMMYFWYYQPRSRTALHNLSETLSREEREIFLTSQNVLKNVKSVCQMFIDGVLGKHFNRPLSFYLDNYEKYLAAIGKLYDKSSNDLD